MVLTPSSRLGDDLYRLYLACMAWFFLPFYGALFNELLPSEWSQFDIAFDLVVIVICLAGVWSGARGGPFMVSRAVILHELGSPASRRRLLLPWLVRQAAAWAMAAAVAATVIIVLADQESFGYRVALLISLAAILAAWSGVFLAAATLVATHESGQALRTGSGIALIVAAVIGAVIADISLSEWTGIVVLAIVACASTGLTAHALATVPVEPLWRRATAVESMRSSLQQFQFQRVLVDLRNATEQPPFSTGSRIAWPGLALPLWRYLAAVQHSLVWHVLRLATFTAGTAALFWWGDLEQGIVALGLAGFALLIGIEVSGAVSATADQLAFVVHYPRGSGRILRGQVLTSVLIATFLGACAVAGRVASEPRAAAGVLVICLAGALGAAVQARLGSPDVARLLARFGPEMLSNVLWGRALLGPLMVLSTTVAVYHQFLRVEPVSDQLYLLIAVLIAAASIVSTVPLERALRRGQG